jgi:hypothetical protein
VLHRTLPCPACAAFTATESPLQHLAGVPQVPAECDDRAPAVLRFISGLMRKGGFLGTIRIGELIGAPHRPCRICARTRCGHEGPLRNRFVVPACIPAIASDTELKIRVCAAEHGQPRSDRKAAAFVVAKLWRLCGVGGLQCRMPGRKAAKNGGKRTRTNSAQIRCSKRMPPRGHSRMHETMHETDAQMKSAVGFSPTALFRAGT